MNSTIKKIAKQLLPDTVVQKYKIIKQKRKSQHVQGYFSKVLNEMNNTKEEKRLLLIGTAVSGNLGDQAISLAEMDFLQTNFPEHTVIEIQQTLYTNVTELVKSMINEKDILLINGGGFLGTLWPIAENMARDIIQSFPNNRVIIFPQTIFFEDSQRGQEELAKSIDTFQKHSDLTIFVRDQASYSFAQKHFIGGQLTNIYLVPDIVTSLNYAKKESERNKIVFCLRRDKEKVDHTALLAAVEQYVNNNANSSSIVYTDTVINEDLDMYNRQSALNKLLDDFSGAKLVITDRLHGMILSAISGTPCLAMNNISGKVKGAYEWVSYLDYIEYVDNERDVQNKIERLLELNDTVYVNDELAKKHTVIKEAILKDR